MRYFSVFRPVTVLAGLLVPVSFKLAFGVIPTESWLLAAAVFMVANATMAENDYADREYDWRKSKTLAYLEPKKFQLLVISLWSAAVLVCIPVMFMKTSWPFFLLSLLIISGLTYSNLQRLPLVANIQVALTCAAPVLFPLAIPGVDHRTIWLLFATIACLIYHREVRKDFEDAEFDRDKKWNVVTVIGVEKSSHLCGLFLCVGILLMVYMQMNILSVVLLLAADILIIRRPSNPPLKVVGWLVDIALVIYLLSIFLNLTI